MNSDDFAKLLASNNIVVTGEVFVYKSGFLGNAYIDKDSLNLLGATVVNNALRSMAANALENGLEFDPKVRKVLLLGPAYGAIQYPPIVAEYLQEKFPDIIFMVGRTQLDENDQHYIPDKLSKMLEMANEIIIIEDIVNRGTTIYEVTKLVSKHVHSAMCLVDRGCNRAEELNIGHFYPFLNVHMDRFDPRVDVSIFDSEMKINTTLGKGALWVQEFGQPPYNKVTDFSSFSLLKQKQN